MELTKKSDEKNVEVQGNEEKNNKEKRGMLIVFEGCDRTGKTSQSKLLFEKMKNEGQQVKLMNFPDRDTATGKVIHSHLTNDIVHTDECIHLLFSANRWERRKEMEQMLLQGINIIVDRYSYSGVAFSCAKGLDLEWCKMSEKGLLKPDVVIYLKGCDMSYRNGFGNERYETKEMQKKVFDMYEQMIIEDLNTNWKIIDANQHIFVIAELIQKEVMRKDIDEHPCLLW
jgi:dTMP kinase